MENRLVKIYTESNNNVLVLECYRKNNNKLYKQKENVIGFGVTGKENISITEDAKKLFISIVKKAKKTGDDLTCLDIFKLDDGKINISWIGNAKEKIDIRKLDEIGFFIGTGEGYPELYLLDELSE